MDALQRAVPAPQVEIIVNRASRAANPSESRRHWQPCRKTYISPFTDFAHVRRALAAAASGRRNQRLDQRPFAVGHIARIAQACCGRTAPRFSVVHMAALLESGRSFESQTIHSIQHPAGQTVFLRGRPSYGERPFRRRQLLWTSIRAVYKGKRLEIVETGRRRRWSEDEKLKIVMESLQYPGQMTVTARRYGISRSQLYLWRRAFRVRIRRGPRNFLARAKTSAFMLTIGADQAAC